MDLEDLVRLEDRELVSKTRLPRREAMLLRDAYLGVLKDIATRDSAIGARTRSPSQSR